MLVTTRPSLTALCQCQQHWVRIDRAEWVDIGDLESVARQVQASQKGQAPSAVWIKKAQNQQEALRGHAQTAVAFDCTSRLLAVGARGVVAIYQCDKQYRVTRRVSLLRIRNSEPKWLSLGHGTLSMVSRTSQRVGPPSIRVTCHQVVNGSIGDVPFFELVTGSHPEIRIRPRAPSSFQSERDDRVNRGRESRDRRSIELARGRYYAAASADGRYLAIGLVAGEIALISLLSGHIQFDRSHRRPIHYLSFVGSHLASADNRGRLVVRDAVEEEGYLLG